MYKNLLVSVVIPCFNEELGIAKVLSQIPAFVDEAIVVNNNSTDNTASNARKYNAHIINVPRRGYGITLKAGIKAARGDVVITLDGDGTYPLGAIKKLVDLLREGNLDFVSGNRINKKYNNSYPLLHLVGNKFLSKVSSVLFNRNISDILSGMMCFRRKVFASFILNEEGMAFSEEIKIQALRNRNIKFAEYPIEFNYYARLGKTKLNLIKDGVGGLMFLLLARVNWQEVKEEYEEIDIKYHRHFISLVDSVEHKFKDFLVVLKRKFDSLTQHKAVSLFLYFCTIFYIFLISLLALNHNPNFEFDEQNTLNIAQQSFSSIVGVLSHEQNFPFYYFLLKSFFSLFGYSQQIAIFFNFSLWLISIIIFYKLLTKYVKKPYWVAFFTFLYTIIPNLVFYSFYIRMYQLINVCVLGILYLNARYIEERKTYLIIAQGFMIMLISLLHPISGIILIAVFIGNALTTHKKHLFIVSSFFLFSLFIYLFQLSQKLNGFTNFTRGTEYIENLRYFILDILPRVIFIKGSSFDSIISVFLLFLMCVFLINSLRRIKYFMLVTLITIFSLLIFYANKYITIQHLTVFTGPLALALFIGLYDLTRYRRFAAVLLSVIFIGFTTAFFYERVSTELSYKFICRSIASVKSGVFITDYYLVNQLVYCNKNDIKIIMWGGNKIIEISKFTKLNILVSQAEFGGLPMLSVNNRAIESSSVINYFDAMPKKPMDIYLYTKEQYLTSQELALIPQGYYFKELLYPSIFHFATKPPLK